MLRLILTLSLASLLACAPDPKAVVNNATTCEAHISAAIHGQPTCTARVLAADNLAKTDPACIAAGVKSVWNCDSVDP